MLASHVLCGTNEDNGHAMLVDVLYSSVILRTVKNFFYKAYLASISYDVR